MVVRSTSASASSLAAPGRGCEDRGDVHSGYAVDQGVVGLADDGEAPAVEAIDQPDLPERLGAIQPLGEQPSGQPLQRRVVAGTGQRRVPDVIPRVVMGVVCPHRPALFQGDVGEPLAVARNQVHARVEMLDQLVRRRGLALEHHDRGDVHVGRPVVLEMQEGGIEGGQAVGVGHVAIVAAGGFRVNEPGHSAGRMGGLCDQGHRARQSGR